MRFIDLARKRLLNEETTVNPFENLVAYYRFDESSGNAIDLINSHNGTLNGDVVRNASGKINDGYLFNSTTTKDGFVSLPTTLANDLDYTNFTICFWVKITDSDNSGFESIITDGTSDFADFQTKVSILLQQNSGRLIFSFDESTNFNTASTNLTPIQNQFYFIQYKYFSDGFIILKANNQTIAKTGRKINGSPNSSNPFYVGGRGASPGFFSPFTGVIDNLFFINGQSSDDTDEILYNDGNGLAYPN
jgi:hypothetical protein